MSSMILDYGAFKDGSIVHLASGGPAMTVAGSDEEKGVMCVWFFDGKANSGIFPAHVLKAGAP